MSVRAIVLTSLVSTFSLAPPVPFPSRPEVPGTQGPNSRWRRDLRPKMERMGAARRSERSFARRNPRTPPGGSMKRSWITLAAGLALVLASGGTAAATVTSSTSRAVTAAEQRAAGDGPPGFWWGTDSWPVNVPGSAPYSMPYLGGAYGGYIGMTGGWAYWLGCKGGFIAFFPTNAGQGDTNYVTYPQGGGGGADRLRERAPQLPGRLGRHRAARHRARPRQRLEQRLHLAVQRRGQAVLRRGDPGPGRLQRVRLLHRGALAVQGRRVLLGRDLDLDLRDRELGLAAEHLRVDLRAGDHQLRQHPVRLVPEVRRVRAVLRRPEQFQPLRADVAVVRRRRREQRRRRLRPDRRRPAGLAGAGLAGAGLAGGPLVPRSGAYRRYRPGWPAGEAA